MALKLKGIPNIFERGGEDGQILKFRGGRRNPEDDNDTSSPTAEIIVAADGTGDFLTIAEALTDLGANPGIIRIKAGTYNISSGINTSANGQHFIGSGWETIIDTTTNNITAFTLDQSNCSIRNLKIVGTRTIGTINDGIKSSSANNVIENVRIEEMGANGIALNASTRNMVQNCSIFDCADSSIVLNGGSDCIVSNNILYNSDQNGIEATSTANFHLITNNLIKDHGDDGILIDNGDDFIIEGNIVEGNGSAATEDNIHILDCVGTTILGNRCRGSAGYGISLDAAATVADRTCIVGNILVNNTTGALDDNGTNTTIAGNITA